MRIFAKILSMLCVAAITFVACDKPVDEPTENPVVTLSTTDVEATAEGGDYYVGYTIANATESVTLSVTENSEWITDVVVETDKINFVVATNDTEEERSATLTVEYLGAQTQSISVRQLAMNSVGDAPFRINVEEVHATTAITQVTPADNSVYYVMYLEEVSYLQNAGFDTQEALWADDYSAFERNAASNNMNLKTYMETANLAFKGTKRVQWSSLLPGVKSVLYVYGIQFNEDGSSYEPVTDIVWEVMQPEYAPLQDVSFSIDSRVSGATVKLRIAPDNWNGYYLVKFVDANNELYVQDESVFTDDYMKIIADEWIYVYDANLSGGYTSEQILKDTCLKGNQVLDVELSSYTMYSALVYPIEEYDGFVQVVAKPSYVNFSTEMVESSDMSIEIEVSNCYVRVADIRVTPSNPNEQYKLLITPTEYLPEDYDDEYLISQVLGEWDFNAYNLKGEISAHLNTLYPDKEYIVVAFGYSGGVVTTDVCTKKFHTEPEGECLLSVETVNVYGPYKPSDLYNYDPERFKYYTPPYASDLSMVVILMEVVTSEPTQDMFVHAFPKMNYDHAGHDIIFFDLLIGTCEPIEATCVVYDYMPYYICAAAFDYKGNVTPMWMSEAIDWNNVEIRPIEECIEKLDGVVASTSQIIAMPMRM